MFLRKKVYWILWILVISVGIYIKIIEREGHVVYCVVREKLGFYCPGCGATRAVEAIFGGHFLEAFWMYPPAVWCALWIGCYLATNSVEYLFGNNLKIGILYRNWYLYVTVILVVLTFIWKNAVLLVTGVYCFG